MSFNTYDSSLRVLLVETDPIRRFAITEMLQEYCTVSESVRFEEILRMLKKNKYHVLVVDHDLTGQGAVTLCMKALMSFSDTIRILVSSTDAETRQGYKDSGLVHEVISRRATPEALVEKVVQALTSFGR